MSEEKIKIKGGRLLFFLVGDNFYISEDSLTVKYSESGLRNWIDPSIVSGMALKMNGPQRTACLAKG